MTEAIPKGHDENLQYLLAAQAFPGAHHERPKRKANENPWYLLATLSGEPEENDKDLQSKNRIAWNRCMMRRLSKEDRDELNAQKRHSAEELKPFSDEEMEDIKKQFKEKRRPPESTIEFPDLSSKQILFSNIEFSENLHFQRFLFPVDAVFFDSTFSGDAQFEGATFSGGAGFVNARMEATTSFANAKFKTKPPDFASATLHEGTIWQDVRWPSTPSDRKSAAEFVRAYERLKLEMDRLKKHRDELDFFACEMQCRRVLEGRWKGLPVTLYGFLSDYGRSYVRPLYGLLATILIGALAFWLYFWLYLDRGPYKFKNALGISLANTFGVFNIRKDFISEQFIAGLPNSLRLISTTQTIIGIVLIFLFGLAFRNHFRIK